MDRGIIIIACVIFTASTCVLCYYNTCWFYHNTLTTTINRVNRYVVPTTENPMDDSV